MIFKLILKEILHRKFNFFLSLLAIISAVTFFVSFFTTSQASKRETIRLTRDMGFNLRIIPKETNMDRFWILGFSEHTMPEKYVNRFMAHKDFSYAHLTATLQKPIIWNNKQAILIGIAPELEPSGKKKSFMSFKIESGSAYIGYELVKSLNLQEEQEIDILGKSFRIEKCLNETGSNDDISIYAQLPDVQEILNMKGQINEIKALNCLCLTDDNQDPIDILREQLAIVLPNANVIQNKTIANARESQRMMMDKYFALIMPFVVIVFAIWIGALAMTNVQDRKQEIGVLRALGYGSTKIAILFLGKAIVIGLIGAALGFYIGNMLAQSYGPGIFKVTAKMIRPLYDLLIWSLVAAPLFAALAAFIPTMIAVTQDPALTLREE
jgi:putative ABC transport system permease protein